MISEVGEIKPCCMIDVSKIHGWKSTSIADGIDAYESNPGLSNLKQSLESGEKISACERCWQAESYGMPSHRQLLSNNDIETGLARWDLYLGNICNLKCRICAPDVSSRYIQEWFELFGEKFEHVDYLADTKSRDEIIKISGKSKLINITGGEPLLMRDHLNILKQLVDDGKAGSIKLQYHTNGTIYPDKAFTEIWKEFDDVELSYSLDGIGKIFEFNRHPAKWHEVESNILRFKASKPLNVRLSINTTLSIFTLEGLVDLFDWSEEHGISKPFLNILHEPSMFRTSVLPIELRKVMSLEIMKAKHFELRPVLKTLEDDTHLLPDLKNRILLQDRYRKESFAEVFPRLASHILA